jgi:hypothetical protein
VVETVLAGADAAVPVLPLTEVVNVITITKAALMGTVVEVRRSLPREANRLIQNVSRVRRRPGLCDTRASVSEAWEDSALVPHLIIAVVAVAVGRISPCGHHR